MSILDIRESFPNHTHAGQPRTIATTAKIVLPFPYPSLLNISGANSGKPNPAALLKNDTAAIADAACSVKLSTTYVCML